MERRPFGRLTGLKSPTLVASLLGMN